ncbi:MAG TPA: Ig-like domain-containing protein, partial [Thermoanaerobaculia bacterium]
WGACSSPATVTLTVTPVIVEPLGDQFYCPQNQSIQIPRVTLLANDYDSEGDPLTIVSFDTSILMGTLDCTTNATYCTYTPPTNGAGYTLFRYTVSDPASTTASAPVRIYVGYPDQAPTASDVFLTTTAGIAKTFTYNDIAFQKAADQDGDTVTIGLQSQQTAYGSLTCSTPFYTCTYTPNPGYVGTDRFLYTATDMIHPPVTAGIDVLTLPLATPTFDAREDVVVTGQNQSTYIGGPYILANDYLPNGGPEVVTSIDTTALTGSLNCDSGGCTYTPPSFYAGITSFKYHANDSHGGTDTAIVRICVGTTNHPPVAAPQTLATPRNTALRFSVFQLMQNSYDPDDDPLTVTVYTGTAQLGTLSCSNPQYWCTYTPNANATGADAISYALSDGQTSVTSTLTINVQ